MAVSNLITVAEYAKSLDNADVRRPPIEMFAASTDVFEAMPFEGLKGSVFQFYRQAVLMSPAFRAINEASSSGHNFITPLQENTAVIDHNIDVDRAIVDRHGPERRSLRAADGHDGVRPIVGHHRHQGRPVGQRPRLQRPASPRQQVLAHCRQQRAHRAVARSRSAQLDQTINLVNKPTHIIAPYLRARCGSSSRAPSRSPAS